MKIKDRTKAELKKLLVFALIIAAGFLMENQDKDTRLFYSLVVVILYVAWHIQQYFSALFKGKEYQCEFKKDIIAPDSEKVLATLIIRHTLPFIPFVGLSVTGDKYPPDASDDSEHDYAQFFTGTITSVNLYYSRFVCKVEPHKMTPSNVLASVIALHYEYGWEIDLMFPDIKKAMQAYIIEQEKELVSAKPDDEMAERNKRELEKLKKKLKL